MKKILLVSAGCTSLSLGVIGIVVPLLPTTPFLLLAAACFVRSSDRLYAWLINHRLFGSYIRNYLQHRAVTVHSKVIAISLIWISIGNSVIFLAEAAWLRIVLLVIAAGVTVYLLRLKTLRPEAQ